MTTLVGVRRALQGSIGSIAQGGAPGVPNPGFWLPLADNGDGTVNTSAVRAAPGTAPTFTRATVAWTKLGSGLWAQIASGSPRSCYMSVATGGADTAVGSYGGYFSEAAGIQLVTPSASIRDMTDASWVKVTMTTAKTSTGIDGVGSSCTRCTATGANATILQTLVAAASTRTYSCFIKRITGSGEIDISEDGATWTNITAQINSSTFSRVQVTVSQLNASYGIRIVTSGDAIDVDFNQFEAGTYATSPMASAGAARNADTLDYTLAGNLVNAQGASYAEAAGFAPVNATDFGVVGDSASGRMPLELRGASATTFIGSAWDGVNQPASTTTLAVNTIGKIAATWQGATFAAYLNGGGKGTATYGGTLVSTAIAIGYRIPPLIGVVKNIKLWTVALSDSQVAAL